MVQRCKFSIELKNFPPDLSGEPLFIPEVMDLEERLKKDSEIREIEIEDYEEKQEKLNKAALLSEREKGVVAWV